MEVGVLGPIEVRVAAPSGAEAVDVGPPRQRALLTALALYAGRDVPVDALVDLVWGDAPPPGVQGTLQAYVSGLRRVLEPQRVRRGAATVLVTVGQGYALRLPVDQLDAARFSRAVRSVHQRLAPAAALVPDPAGHPLRRAELVEARQTLDEVLGLWRGEPYADLKDSPDARSERVRLDELRLLALEDRAVADLWLGEHATVAAELESLTDAYPLRERLWGLRALALARSGRQADALASLAEVRRVLDDDLGLEPSAELRALQTAVLHQDAALFRVTEPAGSARVPSAVPPVAPSSQPVQGWPLVGRESELNRLVGLLDAAVAGRSGFVSLVGEPGIGKTRLAQELIARADDQGVQVLTGRCSQDDGAPPLWPWAALLHGLGRELPAAGGEAGDFAVWQQLVDVVRAAAAETPILMLLDDLHWADPATLRALRLLVEADPDEPRSLLVLLTWRAEPAPTGPLADLAEMLARRHAPQLVLTGLSATEVATVVDTVTGDRPGADTAGALRERTDGNPFFLVSYAQLAAERGGLAGLLDAEPPSAVHDVVVRRLDRLPEAGRTVVRAAAVIGRRFDLAALTAATELSEDEVLDRLEPALRAGLVREDGIDHFVFAHALVRDAAYAGLSASRRARLHARIAAALDGVRDRETEVARHWGAAGDTHARHAWRAAVRAAELAARAHAHEQAAELLVQGLAGMDRDRDLDLRDRHATLLRLADAYRWSAQWAPLMQAAETAIEVARRLDDVEAMARAAVAITVGAIWQSEPHGHVHPTVVPVLRECLSRLPTADHELRARVMLSLATELYYGSTFEERSALVDEALTMAVRLRDDELLLDGYLMAVSALWCSSTAPLRLEYAQRAVALAQRLGHERALVTALTFRAIVECELGQTDLMWGTVQLARREAERLRLAYSLIVLDNLVLPWFVLDGQSPGRSSCWPTSPGTTRPCRCSSPATRWPAPPSSCCSGSTAGTSWRRSWPSSPRDRCR